MADDMIKALTDAAREYNQRVVCVVINEAALVVTYPGEPAVTMLHGTSDDLFDRLEELGHFDDPDVALTWREYARSAATDGVKLRQQGRLAEAYQCQRFALFVAARTKDPYGVAAIVNNVWMIREGLRDILERAAGPDREHWTTESGRPQMQALEWTRAAVMDDATTITPAVQALLAGLQSDASPSGVRVAMLQALHRTACAAGDAELRCEALARITADSQDNDGDVRALLAALDEIAQLDSTAALVIEGLLPPEADEHRWSLAWPIYVQHRDSIRTVAHSVPLTNALVCAFRQLGLLRIGATTAGGAFGHQLSYAVSVLLHAVGVDLVTMLRRAGDTADALTVAESVLSRAMTDWMGRTHAIWRTPRWVRAAIPPITGSLNCVDVATLADVRAAAGVLDAPILYYLGVQEGLAGWLVEQDGSIVPFDVEDVGNLLGRLQHRLPFVPAGGRDAARDLAPPDTAGSTQAELDDALRELHDALLPEPVVGKLGTDGGRLVVVLDPALNTVPFAALKGKDGRYLVQRHDLIVLPSVTAWLTIEAGARLPSWRRARHAQPVTPLVLGKTTYEAGYPSLPGAGAEARQVSRILGVTPVIDDEATAEAVYRSSGAELIHLAAHGFLDEAEPAASFLLLTGGTLVADQLYRYDPGLRVGLVVLSACRTGLGGAHPDSVIGLANAFLIAGAQSVMSTLWPIPDTTTVGLMTSFYRQLLAGHDISQALRHAQIEALRQPETSHPFYWAGFRITGHAAHPFSTAAAQHPRHPDTQ